MIKIFNIIIMNKKAVFLFLAFGAGFIYLLQHYISINVFSDEAVYWTVRNIMLTTALTLTLAIFIIATFNLWEKKKDEHTSFVIIFIGMLGSMASTLLSFLGTVGQLKPQMTDIQVVNYATTFLVISWFLFTVAMFVSSADTHRQLFEED